MTNLMVCVSFTNSHGPRGYISAYKCVCVCVMLICTRIRKLVTLRKFLSIRFTVMPVLNQNPAATLMESTFVNIRCALETVSSAL